MFNLGQLLGGAGNIPSALPAAAPMEEETPFEFKAPGLPALLGIKGGLRDALGTVGDALLTANGADPMYANARKEQETAHALRDFATNPAAAIARYAQIDPMGAKKLETEAAKARAAQMLGNEREVSVGTKARGYASGMLRGANPTTYETLRNRVLQYGNKYGIDYSSELPETYDEGAVAAFLERGLTPDQYADNARDAAWDEARLEDYDIAEQRQRDNTDSMIGSRATRDAHSAARVAQGAARVAQGERRTDAYVSSRRERGERRGGRSSSTPTIRSSQVPASARTGTRADGTRVARFGGKTYTIKD